MWVPPPTTICVSQFCHVAVLTSYPIWYWPGTWLGQEHIFVKIFTNKMYKILTVFHKNIWNTKPTLSDCVLYYHDTMVYIDTNVRPFRQRPTKRKILLWKNADLDKLHSSATMLSKNLTDNYTVNTPINILWESFKSGMDNISEHIPSKMISTRFNQPWVNRKKLDDSAFLRTQSYITEICYFEFLWSFEFWLAPHWDFFQKIHLFNPIHIQSLPKSKLGQV